ncbi:MAG: hypothetical protein RMH97_07080 [Verrucomicrobiales bacterium]|nr:hypothetical protein [Verrucomicrobiales bacterium]
MKKVSLILLGADVVVAHSFAEPALTIYNQNFAVVRDTVRLELKRGVNRVEYTGATMHLEPESVILRDPTGKHTFQILEQNYRADPVSQELLLSLFEGKTIEFETFRQVDGRQQREIIRGKIIRSGYVPHAMARSRYGQEYWAHQSAIASGPGTGQPVVEVDGKIRFGLPGQPLFPSLGDDTILKPTLVWLIQTDTPGKFEAELSYITGGMSWEADYNIVAPEKGNMVDLVGWVTIDNQSGKSFENAKIKLMAGDVQKIEREEFEVYPAKMGVIAEPPRPPVTEKAFEEYHLYTLERPTTLLDRETKQVEFVRATGVRAEPVYVYDGAKIDVVRYRGWDYEAIRRNREYGTQCNTKVWVMREFINSETNGLGMPLPKGRLRFYRRDTDGRLEFVGEDMIEHTPRGELIRVFIGNAFDIVGERKRTDYRIDDARDWLDEAFEIKLRNRKREPVEIRVVEHLYRGPNWEIVEKSHPFLKTDANTIEFRVQVGPDEEKTISYKVHYWW